MNGIQEGVFQHSNAVPHTTFVIQNALQCVDILPWRANEHIFLVWSTYWTTFYDNSASSKASINPALTDIRDCTTQCIYVCMLSFKFLVITPVINVQSLQIWNIYSLAFDHETFNRLHMLLRQMSLSKKFHYYTVYIFLVLVYVSHQFIYDIMCSNNYREKYNIKDKVNYIKNE